MTAIPTFCPITPRDIPTIDRPRRLRPRDLCIPSVEKATLFPQVIAWAMLSLLGVVLCVASFSRRVLTASPESALLDPDASEQQQEYAMYSLDQRRVLEGRILVRVVSGGGKLAVSAVDVLGHESRRGILHASEHKNDFGPVGDRARALLSELRLLLLNDK